MTPPFRRHVLYLPGFDPIPPRRYRELYRREGADQAAISGHRLRITKAEAPGFAWTVHGKVEDRDTRTVIEVALWSDIVQASMRQGIAGTFAQLARTSWTYIATGTLPRLMRLRRGPVIAALYPIAVLLVQLLLAMLAGGVAAWAVVAMGGGWLGLPVALAAVWGVLVLGQRLDHKLFAYYLMHDYAFTARHRGGYPPALEDRLAQFRDRLRQIINEGPDEVLVVGHSSGAYLAVSLLADLLRDRPLPPGGPTLSLLTLGHVVPMAAFLPDAGRLRDDLAWLGRAEGIFWLDVTAPGDACCFALCDPVAVCGMGGEGQRWPLVISAAFTQTLSPERQKAIKNRWFRLHFQYLCAFDKPGDYDYFAITAGPQTLAQRFAGRKPSPARITRAVGARP
ncbi:lipase family protein [Paracoccus gahaiensis]|uniref:Lipase family protein n=1 Tax=Paracoccus gahaiensis TaxID=1706839 RepID=A0A4V5MVN6_9RHOB|nr:lipase family protein [Paracoccus gahaiensis]TJZ92898.1 lipase family protein [Paracoccus gahaiensis]